MFSEHPKAVFWSNKNSKKPNEVALNSHNKFWFDCECGHQFDCNLKNINLLNRWCPYCSNKKLCDENKNCKSCFEKSFASIERSKNWSDKNNEEPYELLKNSHKKYWFDCSECSHDFQTCLYHITKNKSWCPYCANKLLCDESINCLYCINKTFVSIDKSKNWSNKNKINLIKFLKVQQ